MKKVSLTIVILLLATGTSLACSVCAKRQPKIMRGFTHGTGPQSNWDYVIIGIVALIVFICLLYSIKWIVNPGEHEESHIKRSSFIME